MCRFEENGRFSIEFCELFGVDFGELEKGDAEANDQEAKHHGDEGDDAGLEALVEDEGGDEGSRGKGDKVDWDDHGCVEQLECFVEVVYPGVSCARG